MNFETLSEKFIAAGYKQSSILVHMTSIKRIGKELYNGNTPSVTVLAEDKEKIVEHIKTKLTNFNSQHVLLNSCRHIMQVFKNDEYAKYYHQVHKSFCLDHKQKAGDYQEPTDKELDQKVSLSELIKMRDELKDKLTEEFTKSDIVYVILSLCTYLPPLRGQDYRTSHLYLDSNDIAKLPDNYLCLASKKWTISNYKTESVHGKRVIDIPDVLINILTAFKNKSNSEYVICTKRGIEFTQSNLSKFLQNELKLASNMIRKIFVSEEVINKDMNAKDRHRVAAIMGHNVTTAETSYSKFSKRHDTISKREKIMNILKLHKIEATDELINDFLQL